MNKLLPILTACAMLSACQSAPPPPVVAYRPPPRPYVPPKTHHVHRKSPGSTPGVEVATDCPWPPHAGARSATRLVSASTQVAVPAGSAPETIEGCAVLRFAVSKAGTVSWIDVVNARPDTVAPVALKCLLATRFKPSSRPDKEAVIRLDLKSPQPDLVVASLRLR